LRRFQPNIPIADADGAQIDITIAYLLRAYPKESGGKEESEKGKLS
jgi:hypothetical protein